MKIYGRNLSPFTRRVIVTMNIMEKEYTHQPIMVTGEEFEALKKVNPVGRVPALVLDDGEVLIESSAILDHLEDGATRGQRMFPKSGADRRAAMQIAARAHNACEKAVSLVYERQRRPEEHHWPEWQQRLEGQIVGVLDDIESKVPEKGYFGGGKPKGADIAAVCAYDFVEAIHPQLLNHPNLKALSKRANRREAFKSCHPSTT